VDEKAVFYFAIAELMRSEDVAMEAGDSQVVSVRLPQLSAPLAELPEHQKQGLLLFLSRRIPVSVSEPSRSN